MKILPGINKTQDLRNIKEELLPEICKEIRDTILNTVSKNGGHLGSSLGAVELITALHYTYNTPKDKIVFDTGHQAYAHKLLTGRYKDFSKIRTKGGISGFPKRSESEYDTFGVGHASTSLSAALGMAVARDLKKEESKVIAVVSDGALTGGMSYEALQNIGQLATSMLVVLNDNQMFISQRVGSLGKMLTRLLTKKYVQLAEERSIRFLQNFSKLGNDAAKLAKRARAILFPGTIFEEMGFRYFGPINGNDLNELLPVLNDIKDTAGPVLLHVVTKKGKGYDLAEENPTDFHGLGIFDKDTGKSKSKVPVAPTFTKVFGDTIVKLAQKDSKIVGITAAMPEGTGLDKFRDAFPHRYFDVGIAEEHGATFAAGLAAAGMKPVFVLYSSFAQRCYDQILHDVCLQNLPVVFALDRAGVVGEDGPTHHGVFDLSFLRNIPGLIIAAPADENELQHMLKTAFDLKKPVVVRYPRGAGFGVEMDKELKTFEVGKGVFEHKGKDVNILAAGNRYHPALAAAAILKKENIDCGVANMRFVKPLDTGIINAALKKTANMVTVEDNMLSCGFGSAAAEYISDNNLTCNMLRLGIKDEFVEHAKSSELYDSIGISPEKIAQNIKIWLKSKK
ncbi:Deoxyxylulose-5-phosphate synthase [Elusimicrobium minutum Pei191]|uniref:1-deoxy-D-xylulose-5-phosphate synthase n=1 Tax=Elusimicrobium minutum (strain Pei191) TaxID=445932 RepID=B2KBS6_ELUMP|nr:1-deoxy-D-xylulose-5-phosphate synthase [Elusimicrobium minutum]ACC97830.1 Deoxyxylulose-5-phosphate synthase [Elusimicrobium minutum Pei191]